MALATPLKSQLYSHGSELYEISDMYDQSVSGFAGDYVYYGYLNLDGGWIIQRGRITTGEWRYFQGKSDYATNWTGRVGLLYDYYDALYLTNP